MVILGAVSSLVLANVNRGMGYASRAHAGHDRLHHSHTHFHEGEEHTHWHSHHADEDHSQPDPASDHHEEVSDSDHGEFPCVPAQAPSSVGRTTTGKFLGLMQVTDFALYVEPPTLFPAKPPPRACAAPDNLNRLRTVILLT